MEKKKKKRQGGEEKGGEEEEQREKKEESKEETSSLSSSQAASAAIAQSILDQLPKPFDVAAVQQRYPIRYEEVLNTVLVQELCRFNRLLVAISSNLKALQVNQSKADGTPHTALLLYLHLSPDLAVYLPSYPSDYAYRSIQLSICTYLSMPLDLSINRSMALDLIIDLCLLAHLS